VLADALVSVAGVGLTGEALTDAAVLGAVLLGGGAVYAAAQPGQVQFVCSRAILLVHIEHVQRQTL